MAGEVGIAAEGLEMAGEAGKFTGEGEVLEKIMSRLLKPEELGPGEEGMDGAKSITQLYDELFKEPESGAGKSGVKISEAEIEGESGAVPGTSRFIGKGEGEVFGKYASKATHIDGYTDVIIHGAPPNKVGVMHNGGLFRSAFII